MKNENFDMTLIDEKQNKILGFINSDEYKSMKIEDIMLFMEVPSEDLYLFKFVIDLLINQGKLVLTPKRKLMTPKMLNMFYGTYLSTSKGFGFVSTEIENQFHSDIFISEKDANGAMHKDKVLCKVISNNGKKPEGRIEKVLEKGYNSIIGRFEQSKSFGFVIPDEKKLYNDIFIPKKYTMGAVSGNKVVVKIIKEATKDKKPEGKIIEILGHINDPGIDILSIIKQFELPLDFEDDIYDYINNLPSEVLENEKINRTDLRNLITVTIDGEDAKDLDDAITIEKLPNENFKLGVHIADVAHYVKPNTVLDKEALKRGTSIYLVDRVIPMLPHKLSNGICSLNAGEDRLALSCIMEIDKKGLVISYEILETVINVDKRMTYTIVNDILTNTESKFLDEYKDFLDMFKNMEELRNILLKKRQKRGSIEFDFSEAKIILDEQTRKPIDIKIYERNIATSIIEEFMLISNETIAEHFFWLEVPFVYRIHDEPDLEKIEKLSDFIIKFGYFIKGSNIHSKTFQKIINKVKDKPEQNLINQLILRSFKQAKYSTENEGHFGLAAKYYCHFTSPIRRYPDLQIHRIIKDVLNSRLNRENICYLSKNLGDVARKSSIRERVAEDAERETIQTKKVEYMQNKVGEIFDGFISGITSWGIYVQLENTVEGMVPINSIEDDYYIFDEKNLQYFGEKTNKVYSLGDKVKVKLISTNIQEKTLDFKFLND